MASAEEDRADRGDRGEHDEAGVEARSLDDEARHQVAQPGADAGRRGESPLCQVEPAGSPGQVGDHEHRHDAEDARADAVEKLHGRPDRPD